MMFQNAKVRMFFTIIFLIFFDAVILLIGYRIDSFQILKSNIKESNMVSYEISNSSLMFVMAVCAINILAIYHNIHHFTTL